MAVIDSAYTAAARVRFGPPILPARRARSIRRYTAANTVLVLLAGWLASHGTYDQAYGWLAVGGYLAVTVAVQLLSVLPTVRRADTGPLS